MAGAAGAGFVDHGQATGQADHGGGVDAAVLRWGGARADWIDLSTGINPQPWPLPDFAPQDWTALPDREAEAAAVLAARAFWGVPDGAAVLAAPGASALIARVPALMPALMPAGRVLIPGPTYNEHGRAFGAAGWQAVATGPAEARVLVHPNNPCGRVWPAEEAAQGLAPGGMLVIDESFCDVMPAASLIGLAARPGVLVLKSFGKFWGLAGLRLGFVAGDPALVAGLAAMLGPWPVSGPALRVAAGALADEGWAAATRARLATDAARLDALMAARGAQFAGGTSLFRLYRVQDARAWHDRLARARILSRVFPYRADWLRLGLPGSSEGWARLEAAL
ncbi:MAG: threonine-phosphate decarboxylase CobD [Gemmobacter sp.]